MDLSRIELLLSKHEKVEQARALLKENDLENNIEVYIKLHEGLDLDYDKDKDKVIQEMKKYMALNLPYSLMPSHIEIMTACLSDSLENDGKDEPIAKRASEASNDENKTENGEYNNLRVESVLLDVWRSVLGNKGIQVDDNFMDLGGDSLKATAIISQIKKILQVNISFREFFSFPKICLLCKLIDEKNSVKTQ